MTALKFQVRRLHGFVIVYNLFMQNISRSLDSVISKFALFFLGSVIGAYFTNRLVDRLLFGIVFSLCASQLYLHFFSPTEQHRNSKTEEVAAKFFSEHDSKTARDYFFGALSPFADVKRRYKYLSVNETALFCEFLPEPISANEIAKIIFYALRRGESKITIFTLSHSSKAAAYCNSVSDVEIKLVDFTRVFALIKQLGRESDFLPEKRKRKTISEILHSVKKTRSGAFMFSALVLLAVAPLTKYGIYYIFASCFCLALSITIAVFAKN